MRLLNKARLGAVLTTFVVALGVVPGALADATPGSGGGAPVAQALPVVTVPAPPVVTVPVTPVQPPASPAPPAPPTQPTDPSPPAVPPPPVASVPPTTSAPPIPPAPPTTPAPPIPPPQSPVESVTTTETVTQVQVSGCLSHCQGTVQVQAASQQSVTVQRVGTAVQLAGQLEAQPASPSSTQVTRTVTQVQIGCVSHCYGHTATGSSTVGLAQRVLSELGSLVPPQGQPAQPLTPAAEQAVIDEVSAQVQAGTSAQVQTATQSSTAVQQADPGGELPPDPQAVADTGQETWQLQVGCLFYCTDSQQLQEALQSSSVTETLPGNPGSSGAVVSVSQVVWQLQVGCVAWCHDTTELQESSTESTVVLTSPPAPSPSSPEPSRSPAPAEPVAGPPPPAQSGPTAPVVSDPVALIPPPSPPSRVRVRVRLRGAAREAGLAILQTTFTSATVAPPAAPAEIATASSSGRALGAHVVPATGTFTRRAPRLHRPRSHRPTPPPAMTARATVVEPAAHSDDLVLALALAGVAGALAAALRRHRGTTRLGR